MLPIGDEKTSRRIVPFITYILLAVNLFVFYLELTRGISFIERWAFVPNRFSQDPGGEFMTIFSAMFMHGGWLHLGSNMLYLWIFGDNVEDRFGHFNFILFYFLSGIAATFAQYFFSPGSTVPTLGASGAIAGVLAAYMLMFPSRNVRVLMGLWVIRLPAFVVIGAWIILQLLSGYALLENAGDGGGIAYMAHIGGFAAGFIMTFFFRKKR